MLVLAGPGSGKTFVITHRIQYLIQVYGVSPAAILVITFTKAAATEMRNRFIALMGQTAAAVSFGTFHAVFFQILRQHFHYGREAILTEKEKKGILTDIIRRGKLEIESSGELLEQILSEISLVKNRQCTPDVYEAKSIAPELFRQLYSEYQEIAAWKHKLDFDDMQLMCLKLLQEQPALLRQWRQTFSYILIDEFQDISPIQFQIMQLLAQPQNNLFAVGDDDQSIYGFRGSDPGLMLSFRQTYPEAGRILLSTNYRSGSKIVAAAQEVIGQNRQRYEKAIMPAPAAQEGVFAMLPCGTRQEQMDQLLALLQKQRADGLLEATAVICRTNQSFEMIYRALEAAAIPYRCREKRKCIFEDPIRYDLEAYLRLAYGDLSRANFLRIMNKPLRYIRREEVPEQVAFAILHSRCQSRPYMQEILTHFEQDLRMMRNGNVYLAINYLRKAAGYDQYLRESVQSPEKREELLQSADLLQESARGCENLQEWQQRMEDAADAQREASRGEVRAGVSIMTMHGSKGLEFDTVYMPDCNEGKSPHHKARLTAELEEERRMFYVGMTRAKRQLILLYVTGTKEKPAFPSRFLPLQNAGQ